MSGSSEVSKLREHLDLICSSMHRGLHDYATVGRHDIITHKYEMLGKAQEQLAEHVGHEQAFQEVLDALSRSEKASQSEQIQSGQA